MKDYLISIDPGTRESGVCIVRTKDMRPLASAKVPNENLIYWVMQNNPEFTLFFNVSAVTERMQGNSFAVGSDVFTTCEWIGRFDVELRNLGIEDRSFILRRDEYRALCGKEYTHNDKGIRQALVDRFAYGEPNYGKGTVKNPGWFHGFGADIWQAYGIAVAHIDRSRA